MSAREPWRRVFATRAEATAFLCARGFSIGQMQHPSPRGIMLGDWLIQKWRGLTVADRRRLHGDAQNLDTDFNGPVAVTIYATAPAEAHEAVRRDERVPA